MFHNPSAVSIFSLDGVRMVVMEPDQTAQFVLAFGLADGRLSRIAMRQARSSEQPNVFKESEIKKIR
jgi:hypothetical protein